MPFKHVALLGLGLIASSISLALRRNSPDTKITGFSRSEKTQKFLFNLKKLKQIFQENNYSQNFQKRGHSLK